MNRANSKMRARTAVDLLNATILLLKMECARFNRMKQEAWGGNSILTPWGKDEYDATFTNLNPSCWETTTIGSNGQTAGWSV